ncbi:hypothetical protein CTI12_AA175310 [Artemisia annua]|uniref:PPC domain-containing protein n=1 Tax=Artemisia annua TaxID=35608 RepID=A0A2U1PAH7_ARTAN|nr:hypothetical protein CTI12_AA175310 [Artemisia annua]
MSPYVLELPAGVDIVETVNSYCRTRNMALCILTGSGTVTNVTLRQPTTTPPASVTFHGRFDILSISATVIPAVSPSAPFANGFTISLAGPQGQIVGGAVSGQLISGGTSTESMSMYLPSDVIWAPSARQAASHQPPY